MLKTGIMTLLIIKMLKRYLTQYCLGRILKNPNFNNGNRIIVFLKKKSIKALPLSTTGKVTGNVTHLRLNKNFIDPWLKSSKTLGTITLSELPHNNNYQELFPHTILDPNIQVLKFLMKEETIHHQILGFWKTLKEENDYKNWNFLIFLFYPLIDSIFSFFTKLIMNFLN